MQEIQPEIKRIQRELKHDKQAQQAAMMELYSERGVNPAAGCLPLILQMPIWFALFSVLRTFGSDNPLRWVTEGSKLYDHISAGGSLDFLGMDLTRTPSTVGFGGTLADGTQVAGDLVAFIPYAIIIAVVVFTAYWQQKQTMARTSQSNPQQQQQPGQAVMKIFPFFFGFISFSMPTGLVVYFAASQIFRIGQQALIISLDEKKDAARAEQAKLDKQSKKSTTQPPAAAAEDGETDEQPPVKRRPQGSKKKRGKKRRY
jgi:YidC/Oxa1 family membrane protein insertase